MKKLTLYGLIAVMLAGLAAPLQARDRDDRRDDDDRRGHDHRHHHYRHRVDPVRVVWVIERGRPVKRVVFVDSRGNYYRKVYGRNVYIRERTYTSYPSRYYYSDGRPRGGISISIGR